MVTAAASPSPPSTTLIPNRPAPTPLFKDRQLFAGIGEWPNLNQAFRQRSLDLFTTGEGEWRRAGGVFGDDGEPSLFSPSHVVAETLADIVNQGRCFSFTDVTGCQWGVIVAADDPEHPDIYTATAVGCDFSLGLLDRPLRFKHRDSIIGRLTELSKSNQRPTKAHLRIRTHYSHLRRWLATLDDAIALAREMFDTAYFFRPSFAVDVRLKATNIWGSDMMLWSCEWRSEIIRGFSMLANIQVQTMRFLKNDWRPEPIVRRPAVLSVEWFNEEEGLLAVHLAPEFVEFMSHWLWPHTGADDKYATDLSNYPYIKKEPFDRVHVP